MNKALVIGCGSIGMRHMKVLQALSLRVYFVSMRTDLKDLAGIMFRTLTEAFLEHNSYDLVVIANETIKHEKTLIALRAMGYTGPVIVEKPLFAVNNRYDIDCSSNIYVGYNLRFHPLTGRIKKLIAHKKVYSAQLHVGQYLPTWRERDYRYIYSSKKAMGGGVLRDLSHELDLSLYLFGAVKKCVSNMGRYSSLQIDSEDSVDILSRHDKCSSVSIHLDYTDNIKKRTICLQCEGLSIEGNFINNTLRVDSTLETLPALDTYMLQNEAVLNSKSRETFACTYAQGLDVMAFIEMIEKNNIGMS